MGRFLKEYGKADKTKAGKMMVAVGKTTSYSGQQRLAIRVPLVRLYQEVTTYLKTSTLKMEDVFPNGRMNVLFSHFRWRHFDSVPLRIRTGR